MLKRFLSIAQDILAYISQVNVQVTTSKCSIRVGQKWVHEPELNILNVGFLKIGIVQFAHDTAPTLVRVGQLTIHSDLFGRNIVWSTLIRIVAQVQYCQFCISVWQHFLIGIYLLFIHDTCAVVGHCLQVVLNVFRCIALWVTKDWVHGVPSQQRTVLVVIVRRWGRGGFGERSTSWCWSQSPIGWIVNVDIGFGSFEVIDIRRTYIAYIFGVARDQVCKFSIHLKGRRCCSLDPRNLVN